MTVRTMLKNYWPIPTALLFTLAFSIAGKIDIKNGLQNILFISAFIACLLPWQFVGSRIQKSLEKNNPRSAKYMALLASSIFSSVTLFILYFIYLKTLA